MFAKLPVHIHIGHAVTQHLKNRDWHTKLFAGIEVFGGQLHQLLHNTDGFGAEHQGTGINGLLQHSKTAAAIGDQAAFIELHIKMDIALLMTVDVAIALNRYTIGLGIQQKQCNTLLIEAISFKAGRDQQIVGLRRIKHGDFFAA